MMSMSPRISLVVPCLNEEANVPLLVERFLSEAKLRDLTVEVVLVDDGSTDATWAAIQRASELHGSSVLGVRHSTNRGIPAGWISGVEASTGENICLIDGDLQNPPEAVFELHDRFVSGDCDLVRGVRRPIAANSRVRVAMSRSLNGILNVIFGMSSRDNKSGFLLGSGATMSQVVRHHGHYRHFQTFVGVSAHARGFIVAEVDTEFHDRRAGLSFLTGRSVSVILDVFKDVPEALREFGSRFRRQRSSGDVPRP